MVIMYIRLYSKDSRPRMLYKNEGITVLNRRNIPSIKYKLFKKEVDKPEEITDPYDKNWFMRIDLGIDKTCYEDLCVGRTYWVSADLNEEPLEYKIESRYDLEELRAYILWQTKFFKQWKELYKNKGEDDKNKD